MLEPLDVAVAEGGLREREFFFSRFFFFVSRVVVKKKLSSSSFLVFFSCSFSPSSSLTCFPCLRSQEANLGSESSMASAKALDRQSSRWKGQWDLRERESVIEEREKGERERRRFFPCHDEKGKKKTKKKRLVKSKRFSPRTFWHARQQYQAVLHLEQRSRLSVSPQFPGRRGEEGEEERRRKRKTAA